MFKDIEGVEYDNINCLGCSINDGTLKPFGGILYRSKSFVVSQDFELPINGFIIISPIRHVCFLNELEKDELTELALLANKVINLLKEFNVSENYNIIIEEKDNVHLHLWCMPSSKWMIDRFGKVLKNVKAIQDYSMEHMRDEENKKGILLTCEYLKKRLNKD